MAENLPDTNVGNIEYISKQDAVDMCRNYPHLAYLMSIVVPADVVQVVRCRDCKYDISSQFDTAARCNLWGCLKPKKGFCDAGKRREVGETND